MRIYIAGPLSSPDPAQRLRNVRAAIHAGIAVYQLGHVPMIPHLTHFLDVVNLEIGAGLTYEDFMRVDLAWLDQCDGVVFLGHSPGADRELAYAEAHGLAVYHDGSELPPALVGAGA